MKVQIVELSGKQGAGKDTTAIQLQDLFHDVDGTSFHMIRFAKPIYDLHDLIRKYMADLGMTLPAEVAIKDGDLMQAIGLWGRKRYGEDVWLKTARAKIDQTIASDREKGVERCVIAITDCRFKNEFHAFQEALRVRLECARSIRQSRVEMWRDNDQHQSEIDLDDYVMGGHFDLIFNTQTQNAFVVAEVIKSHLDADQWIANRHDLLK